MSDFVIVVIAILATALLFPFSVALAKHLEWVLEIRQREKEKTRSGR